MIPPLNPHSEPDAVARACPRLLGSLAHAGRAQRGHEEGLGAFGEGGEPAGALRAVRWPHRAAKEAVISSQIEGTQATLVDLLTFEATEGVTSPAPPSAGVEEVCNYVDALHFARSQLADPHGPPLSMRVLNATHARLMRGARGVPPRSFRTAAVPGAHPVGLAMRKDGLQSRSFEVVADPGQLL